jgi:hypothetical protein
MNANMSAETVGTAPCGFRVLRQNASVHTSKNCSELFGPK